MITCFNVFSGLVVPGQVDDQWDCPDVVRMLRKEEVVASTCMVKRPQKEADTGVESASLYRHPAYVKEDPQGL